MNSKGVLFLCIYNICLVHPDDCGPKFYWWLNKITNNDCLIGQLVQIQIFSFSKMQLKMSVRWRSFCLGLNVFRHSSATDMKTNVHILHITMIVFVILNALLVQVQVQVFYSTNRSTWYNLQSVCSSFMEGGRTEKQRLSSCPPRHNSVTMYWDLHDDSKARRQAC